MTKIDKRKDFKEENLSDNNKKEDEEMVKYKRVRSHYKRICRKGKPCKRVYVKAHLRKVKKKK
jgi:thymidylate kinase